MADDGHPALVRNRRELAEGLFTFSLDPPDAIRGTFHTPGQYHRLAVGGVGESYFALASSPESATFEYLARAGTPVADALVDGVAVTVSGVMGPGFPLDAARGHNLLMVATGTGIAPIRAVIQWVQQRRAQYGRVRLVYGVRTERELAFASELTTWADAGIELHITLSAVQPGWAGEVGRVQQRLASLELDDTFAFLCGQPTMESEVTEILVKLGLEPSRIFINH